MKDVINIKNLAQYPLHQATSVIIGPKYQVVIPKEARKQAKKIKPGEKVTVTPIDEYTVNIRVKPRMEDWVQMTKGIGKGLWGKKPDKYLKDLRKGWRKRLSKIHSPSSKT